MRTEEFREQLRRELLRRTLSEVGARYGVSRVSVAKWADGRRNPSKTVLILAEYLADAAAGSWPNDF